MRRIFTIILKLGTGKERWNIFLIGEIMARKPTLGSRRKIWCPNLITKYEQEEKEKQAAKKRSSTTLSSLNKSAKVAEQNAELKIERGLIEGTSFGKKKVEPECITCKI